MIETTIATDAPYRVMFECSPQSMFVFDQETLGFLAVNDAALRMYGFSREEFLSMTIRDIRPPEDVARVVAIVKQLPPGLDRPHSARHRTRDGALLDVEVTTHSFSWEGRAARLALVRDVTEHRRAEEERRQSEARFRALYEDNPTMLFTVGADGTTLSVNQFGAGELGYAPEELVGRSVLGVFHPDDRAEAVRRVEHCLANPGQAHRWELRKVHRSGRLMWVRETARAVSTPGGEAAALIVCEDITAEKRAEAALARSEAKFRSLIENASEVVSVIDADGTVRYESPSVLRILGYTPEEMVGRNLFEFVHPEDAAGVGETVGYVLEHPGEPVSYQLRFLHKGGHWIALEGIGVNLLDDPAVGGIVANSRDITERVEAQARLEAYSRELERSNRELQDFAYIASHDLQEPLRKVQAFGDRLKSRYAEALGETGRDYLERMQGAAGRMQVLIQDLLAYSRVTSRAQPFAEVDLAEIAREVLSDLAIRVERSGGRVEVGPLPTTSADPLQMRQLLQNLLGNALKFHREGAPPVVRLSGARREDGLVELVVADDGVGFEPEYAERIFRPFERLHGRGGYEGTGMGLAICRKIAERHGGSISARSVPGEGSVFTITLPANPVTLEAAR